MKEIKWPQMVSLIGIFGIVLGAIYFMNKLKISIELSSVMSIFVLILANIGVLAGIMLRGLWNFITTFIKEYKEEQRQKDTELKETLLNMRELREEENNSIHRSFNQITDEIKNVSNKITRMNEVLLDHVEQKHSKDEHDITQLKLLKP